MPSGTEVCNIEFVPGEGSKAVLAGGSYATILKTDSNLGYSIVRLPSGEVRRFSKFCKAMVGRISNPLNKE